MKLPRSHSGQHRQSFRRTELKKVKSQNFQLREKNKAICRPRVSDARRPQSLRASLTRGRYEKANNRKWKKRQEITSCLLE